jgi:NAD(P)-dependent dehydrogenase (short-subunit alcohol dehydrogenase family)
VFRVNVSSQHLLTKALMPILEASENASVIFTTSGVGRVGRPFWGAYAASKFAVEGMVQIWAAENEGLNSVRINCINPALLAHRCALQPFLQRTQRALHRLKTSCRLTCISWGLQALALTGNQLMLRSNS